MTEKRLFSSNRELIKELFPAKLFELIIGIDNVLHDLCFKASESIDVPLRMGASGELIFNSDRILLIYNFGNIEFFVQISAYDRSALYWFDSEEWCELIGIDDLGKMKAVCLAKQMTEIIEK